MVKTLKTVKTKKLILVSNIDQSKYQIDNSRLQLSNDLLTRLPTAYTSEL